MPLDDRQKTLTTTARTHPTLSAKSEALGIALTKAVGHSQEKHGEPVFAQMHRGLG